jgi:hypothetical protein
METIHNGIELDVISTWYHGFDYPSYNSLKFQLLSTHHWNKTMVVNEQVGYRNDDGNNEKSSGCKNKTKFCKLKPKNLDQGMKWRPRNIEMKEACHCRCDSQIMCDPPKIKHFLNLKPL